MAAAADRDRRRHLDDGPVSIEGYYDEALAVPGLLVEIARGEREGADAAIIACFDDTGLDAARALAAIPVIGICEAALSLAAFIAQRFTVVTTMERSRIPIEALVAPLRHGGARQSARGRHSRCWRWKTRPPARPHKLRHEIARAMDEDRAEAIVLGCAGMADLAAMLQREFGVPVVDGVGGGQAGRGAGRARLVDVQARRLCEPRGEGVPRRAAIIRAAGHCSSVNEAYAP